jgi:hypothetical protein
MGLFALPLYDEPKKNAEAAISNLRLYISGEGGTYNLTFALGCVERAIEQEKELSNDKRSR